MTVNALPLLTAARPHHRRAPATSSSGRFHAALRARPLHVSGAPIVTPHTRADALAQRLAPYVSARLVRPARVMLAALGLRDASPLDPRFLVHAPGTAQRHLRAATARVLARPDARGLALDACADRVAAELLLSGALQQIVRDLRGEACAAP